MDKGKLLEHTWKEHCLSLLFQTLQPKSRFVRRFDGIAAAVVAAATTVMTVTKENCIFVVNDLLLFERKISLCYIREKCGCYYWNVPAK